MASLRVSAAFLNASHDDDDDDDDVRIFALVCPSLCRNHSRIGRDSGLSTMLPNECSVAESYPHHQLLLVSSRN
jgi:hypothetical protein